MPRKLRLPVGQRCFHRRFVSPGEALSMRTLISSCGSSVTSAAASASDTSRSTSARNTSSAAMMASPGGMAVEAEDVAGVFAANQPLLLAQDFQHVAIPTLARKLDAALVEGALSRP